MTLFEAYSLVSRNPSSRPFLCRNHFKHGKMDVVERESGSLTMVCPTCRWSVDVEATSVLGARLLHRATLTKHEIEDKKICPACLWVTDIDGSCDHKYHAGDAKRRRYVAPNTGRSVSGRRTLRR